MRGKEQVQVHCLVEHQIPQVPRLTPRHTPLHHDPLGSAYEEGFYPCIGVNSDPVVPEFSHQELVRDFVKRLRKINFDLVDLSLLFQMCAVLELFQ